MTTRIFYQRTLHSLTGSLAVFAQRVPLIKHLTPIFGSPLGMKFATPLTVSFAGMHSLSGQTTTIRPVGDSENPAEAKVGEPFVWTFESGPVHDMQSASIEGLPEGLTGGFSSAASIGFIGGEPEEAGVFEISIVGYRRLGMTGDKTPVYTLTLNVEGDAPDPFSVWLGEFFEPDELEDPAISGPNADPDKDGIENFLEFVLDLDPTESSQMPGEFVVDPLDASMFRYEIPLNVDAADVAVLFQESTTLKPDEWIEVEEAEFIRTDESIVLKVPRENGGKLYRLRAGLGS